MDGEHPLSVGEVLFENPAPWGPSEVQAFFEDVMAAELGTELAYYPRVSVAGRLSAGTIRTGDIMALESWENRIEVLEVGGADLAPVLRTRVEAQGERVADERRYEMAVPDYVASHPEEFDFGGGGAFARGLSCATPPSRACAVATSADRGCLPTLGPISFRQPSTLPASLLNTRLNFCP